MRDVRTVRIYRFFDFFEFSLTFSLRVKNSQMGMADDELICMWKAPSRQQAKITFAALILVVLVLRTPH